jgi:hypothetical protein
MLPVVSLKRSPLVSMSSQIIQTDKSPIRLPSDIFPSDSGNSGARTGDISDPTTYFRIGTKRY